MKSETEIQEARDRIRPSGTSFAGMTYEEGLRTALEWVMGDIEDDEFFDGVEEET